MRRNNSSRADGREYLIHRRETHVFDSSMIRLVCAEFTRDTRRFDESPTMIDLYSEPRITRNAQQAPRRQYRCVSRLRRSDRHSHSPNSMSLAGASSTFRQYRQHVAVTDVQQIGHCFPLLLCKSTHCTFTQQPRSCDCNAASTICCAFQPSYRLGVTGSPASTASMNRRSPMGCVLKSSKR